MSDSLDPSEFDSDGSFDPTRALLDALTTTSSSTIDPTTGAELDNRDGATTVSFLRKGPHGGRARPSTAAIIISSQL